MGVRGEIEGSRVRPGHQTFVSRLGGPRLTGTLRAVVVPEFYVFFEILLCRIRSLEFSLSNYLKIQYTIMELNIQNLFLILKYWTEAYCWSSLNLILSVIFHTNTKTMKNRIEFFIRSLSIV